MWSLSDSLWEALRVSGISKDWQSSPSSQQEGSMSADLCDVTRAICGKRLKMEKQYRLQIGTPKVTRADAPNGNVDV